METQIMHIRGSEGIHPTKTLRALNFAEFPISEGEIIDQKAFKGKAFDHLVRLQKLGLNRFMTLHFKCTHDLMEETIEVYPSFTFENAINTFNETIRIITTSEEDPLDDLFLTIVSDIQKWEIKLSLIEGYMKHYSNLEACYMRSEKYHHIFEIGYQLFNVREKLNEYAHLRSKVIREIEYLQGLIFDIDIIREN